MQRLRAYELPLALAIALVAGGCLGDTAGSESIPARAQASAEHLPARQREAAEALVRLESAARIRDASELCTSVYVFASGPTPGCEKTMERLYPTEDGFSITIRAIHLHRRRATANAGMAVVGADGRTQSFPDSTFRLIQRDGAWRVVFIT